MRQYIRDWKFTITPYEKDASGKYKFSTPKSFSGIRVVFDIRNTLLGDPSLANFQLYNIAPETREMLSTGFCYVTMEIGYKGGTLAPVFRGEVVNTYELRMQADSVQYIAARDSNDMINNFRPKVDSFETEQTPKQILEKIIEASPNITGITYIGTSRSVISSADPLDGYTILGFLGEELNSLLTPLQLKWHVFDGNLRIINENDPTKQLAGDESPFNVSIDTGMLTRPKVNWVSVKFDHLMNSRFTCDRLIQLDPLTVERDFGNKFYVPQDDERVKLDGLYRIMQAHHKGDTRGRLWKTAVIAYTKTGA